jgi:cytidylate kinase
MAIITISRGSYSKGREVAEKVAERLGYRLTSRDVLLDASDRFNVPEIKLKNAIHDAPSIFNRFTHFKECYLAYIQSALADQAQDDNLVYHGLAGHLLLKDVPHVIKVRIISDLAARVETEMQREGISENEARRRVRADDEERRKWTQHLFNADPWDASLYDLVIHIQTLKVADAVGYIVHAAGLPCFKTSKDGQRKMDDLALACRVKVNLIKGDYFDLRVTCEFGNLVVYTTKSVLHQYHLDKKLATVRQNIPGINNLEIHTDSNIPNNAV